MPSTADKLQACTSHDWSTLKDTLVELARHLDTVAATLEALATKAQTLDDRVTLLEEIK